MSNQYALAQPIQGGNELICQLAEDFASLRLHRLCSVVNMHMAKSDNIRGLVQDLNADEATELLTEPIPPLEDGVGKQACKMRVQPQELTGRFCRRTGGALFCFCINCGMMLTPMELAGAESVTSVALYLTLLLGDLSFLDGRTNGRFCICYDDACHLLRFMQLRKDTHPLYKILCERLKAVLVVDLFHWGNHRGRWCAENVNPYKVPEVSALGEENQGRANTSVAEQRFKYIARHRLYMNAMNGVHFNAMLQYLCFLDARRHGVCYYFG
jgi:hypothetical protein